MGVPSCPWLSCRLVLKIQRRTQPGMEGWRCSTDGFALKWQQSRATSVVSRLYRCLGLELGQKGWRKTSTCGQKNYLSERCSNHQLYETECKTHSTRSVNRLWPPLYLLEGCRFCALQLLSGKCQKQSGDYHTTVNPAAALFESLFGYFLHGTNVPFQYTPWWVFLLHQLAPLMPILTGLSRSTGHSPYSVV